MDPAWRRQGIAAALTQPRLRWAFARTGAVSYMTEADNTASLQLHATLGFSSERSATGLHMLSQLAGLRRILTQPAPPDAQNNPSCAG